ncbi:1,2-phenylacetyl-CoA epoxidase subunit B [Tumebacillus sp. ITR2]|uniref:1,2-phenylacetyl-CoA epoxidase subunit B n=1 Tax=Tumebacillus amylolyticus TaxID=2801339 RepID=A0ABS1J8D6_9BACL|nr:1,2-phenylacetyl-CoA epoxidase subunit PaaB [Tumebacillus amylolyticus]MBL0386538.1 1,2-phenylacetyl-CoA epoxidase subunit B [Tumebacillus amylolyticus]
MSEQAKQNGFDIYEVFSQRTHNSSFVHQFSLLAPNHEVAMSMARENFLRRDAVVNIWVVKRENVYVCPPEEREFLQRLDNKEYRETKGYGDLQAKWRAHRDRYEQQQQSNKQ